MYSYRFSTRHLVALLTIIAALTMVIVSTARAGDSTLIHHNNAPQSLYIAPSNAPITINIQGFAFVPNNVQITTGTMVTWTNLDGAPHTSSSLTAVWDSGTLSQNQSFSFTFNSTGTFQYRCNIHTSMTGTITVVDPPTNTPTVTATNTPTATNSATATPSRTNTPVRAPGYHRRVQWWCVLSTQYQFDRRRRHHSGVRWRSRRFARRGRLER